MKETNYENHYERLYKSNLKNLEQNLDSFIKQKEKDYFEKHSSLTKK